MKLGVSLPTTTPLPSVSSPICRIAATTAKGWLRSLAYRRAVGREAFDEVGGYDEQFHPAWYEDVDFCRRLKTAGWSTYFAPQARFLHEGGYSARALGSSAFAAAYYRNQLRYVQKHLGAAAGIAVRGSMAVGMIGRMFREPAKARAYWRVLVGALGGW